MRFASSRSSRPRLRDLVVTLDSEPAPAAHTWRVVAEAAVKLELPRPSYPHVRRLVLAERRRQRLRRARDQILKEAANTIAAGRVPGFDHTLGRLLDAQTALAAEEACVPETQASLDA